MKAEVLSSGGSERQITNQDLVAIAGQHGWIIEEMPNNLVHITHPDKTVGFIFDTTRSINNMQTRDTIIKELSHSDAQQNNPQQ